MKKILLTVSVAISTGVLFAQSQRLVLVEEATQASCGPCASVNPSFNSLLVTNASKVASIKYQSWWPGTDPMNTQNPTEIKTRIQYYGIDSYGVPDGVIDGKDVQYPGNITQSTINTAYAVPSHFDMKLYHWFNAANDSIFIMCNVTCTQANTMTTPKLQVAMIEKTITFTSAPGTNGEKVFEHVMTKMYPDGNGSTIATAWTLGQTQTYTFKGKIPTYIYKKSEIATVAWIQDNSNKNVKQAAYNSVLLNPTGFKDIISNNSLNISPNPNAGLFTANFFTQTNDNYTVKITNTLGQIVYEEALNNFNGSYSKQIDISNFGKGIYVISVHNYPKVS